MLIDDDPLSCFYQGGATDHMSRDFDQLQQCVITCWI